MRKDWRIKNDIPLNKEKNAKLAAYVKRLADAAQQERGTQPVPGMDDDFMLIQKLVPARMGKWRLIPPEAEEKNNR